MSERLNRVRDCIIYCLNHDFPDLRIDKIITALGFRILMNTSHLLHPLSFLMLTIELWIVNFFELKTIGTKIDEQTNWKVIGYNIIFRLS